MKEFKFQILHAAAPILIRVEPGHELVVYFIQYAPYFCVCRETSQQPLVDVSIEEKNQALYQCELLLGW